MLKLYWLVCFLYNSVVWQSCFLS